MANYKVKKHEKMLETESGRIAFALKLLDDWFYVSKDWHSDLLNKNEVEIYDDIFVVEDGLSGFYYTVIKPVEFKPNRYRYKVVRMYDTYDEMVRMLDAQSWAYT